MLLGRQMLSAGGRRVAVQLAPDRRRKKEGSSGEETVGLYSCELVLLQADVARPHADRPLQKFKYEFRDREAGADTSKETGRNGRKGN